MCRRNRSAKEKGETLKVVRAQVTAACAGLEGDGEAAPVFAYEPVWAIGSGKGCTAEDAKVVHAAIRDVLGKKLGKEIAKEISIIYGGSVDQRSVAEYVSTTDIDGVLVGGASLDPRAFGLLCRAANPA